MADIRSQQPRFQFIGQSMDKASGACVAITINGVAHQVPDGISVAAAMLLNGVVSERRSPVHQTMKSPYCMMGTCFNCLMAIDGMMDQRTCQIEVRDGMVVHSDS